jgi:hypothetical protein
MLHEFSTLNRDELIARCRHKVAKRSPRPVPAAALERGVPLFLQQLADTLRGEQLTTDRGGHEAQSTPARTEIGRAAAQHGADLLHRGYSMGQVVHEYGDVCQAVTDLAVDQQMPISTDEFRTLNRCLDSAIADAVTSFGVTRQTLINDQAATLHERLNYFAEEQQRLIDVAIHSYTAIRTGNVGPAGATGNLLMHALDELRALGERTLPEIRLASATTTMAPLTAKATSASRCLV